MGANSLNTYNTIGNREDLTDYIGNITRYKTPLFSDLPKTKVSSTLHEWQTDTLATGSTNAAAEGADFTFGAPALRVRLTNRSQIFTKTVEVSRTQRKMSTAGVDDEFAYQMGKRMKEIATDIEKAILTGTGNAGTSAVAREMKGILAFITTNIETGTSTTAAQLSETRFNNGLQKIWDQGGEPDNAYVNSWQKRAISNFTSNGTRFLQVNDADKIKNTVSVYESDFGVITVHLNSFMDTDKVLLLQKDLWAVGVFDGIHPEDIAKTADGDRAALVGEYTLESRNEKGSCKITNLLTS